MGIVDANFRFAADVFSSQATPHVVDESHWGRSRKTPYEMGRVRFRIVFPYFFWFGRNAGKELNLK